MKSTLKYDRVILIKELNDKFKQIGEVFEIANIFDDSFLLRDSKTRAALGVVNFEDFEKHFVHEENFKGWTQWTPMVGFDGQTDVFYRTNKRKVQVKFLTNNVRSEACCFKGDEFNLSFGIRLAYLRCLNKSLIQKANNLEEELKKIDVEILNNINIEKKMVNSLES